VIDVPSHGVGRESPLNVRLEGRRSTIGARRDDMTERERRSLRPTANWQVWTIVFVVLVLIMTVLLLLR
jgi:hypothetical protein